MKLKRGGKWYMGKVVISSQDWFRLKDLFEEISYFISDLSGDGFDKKGRNNRWLDFLKRKLLSVHRSIVSTLAKESDELYWAKYDLQYFIDFDKKLYLLEEVLTQLYPEKEGVLWGVNGIRSQFNQYDIWNWYSRPFIDVLKPLFELANDIFERVIIKDNEKSDYLEVV